MSLISLSLQKASSKPTKVYTTPKVKVNILTRKNALFQKQEVRFKYFICLKYSWIFKQACVVLWSLRLSSNLAYTWAQTSVGPLLKVLKYLKRKSYFGFKSVCG